VTLMKKCQKWCPTKLEELGVYGLAMATIFRKSDVDDKVLFKSAFFVCLHVLVASKG